MKPGWKTTEWYGSWAVKILGALIAGGVFGDGTTAFRIAGAAMTLLGYLGYAYSRSTVKNAAAGILAVLFLAGVTSQMACGSASKSAAKTVAGDAIDCTTPDRLKLEAQFGPTIELALQRAIGQDGKIDLPSLNQIGRPLEADGWCVLEREAARLIAWVTTKVGTASAEAPLDAADLAGKLGGLRAAKFPDASFRVQ